MEDFGERGWRRHEDSSFDEYVRQEIDAEIRRAIRGELYHLCQDNADDDGKPFPSRYGWVECSLKDPRTLQSASTPQYPAQQ